MSSFFRYACLFLWMTIIGSCSGKSGSDQDSGPGTDGDTDTDGDSETGSSSDSDSDSDSDTDADTDADTDTGTVTDAGPWEWVDNPEGEDCGPECTQLTFAEDVRSREWDVWDNYLVYCDGKNATIYVVDVENKKHLRIPDVYSEYPILPEKSSPAAAFSPSIYMDTIYYALFIHDSKPTRDEIIQADLLSSEQLVVWRRDNPPGQDFDGYYQPRNLDVYGERLVSSSGAGDPSAYTLSTYSPPWPTKGEALIDDFYGGYNSLWENVLVFWDIRDNKDEITGYDFDKKEFFKITDDEEEQSRPRVYKRKVVFMDLRHGDSTLEGPWANAAVYMKDLDSGEEKHIAGGKWIAADPDVFDDIVIWLDYRNSADPNNKDSLNNTEVWGFNLKTEKSFQITDLPGRRKAYPRIWGDKVFVQMFFKDGKGDGIYMFDLPEDSK